MPPRRPAMRLLISISLIFVVPTWGFAGPPDYLKEVKPLLAKNCFQCHGLKAQKGGLRVDTLKALLSGGDTGPAIVPGKSGESLLIAALSGAEGVTRMPLKKPPLPPQQIATLKAWIDAGAVAPANDRPDDGKQGAVHWAFAPPVRPAVPGVGHAVPDTSL